jgi:hypothetical protein
MNRTVQWSIASAAADMLVLVIALKVASAIKERSSALVLTRLTEPRNLWLAEHAFDWRITATPMMSHGAADGMTE